MSDGSIHAETLRTDLKFKINVRKSTPAFKIFFLTKQLHLNNSAEISSKKANFFVKMYSVFTRPDIICKTKGCPTRT